MKHTRNASRILLTEDEPIVLKVHHMYLEKMGFVVDVAISGWQAVQAYKSNHELYKFILLDIGLPDINGFDVAQCIRRYESEKQLKRIPLLILSGYPREQIQEKYSLADVDDFAIKPITVNALQEMLTRWL